MVKCGRMQPPMQWPSGLAFTSFGCGTIKRRSLQAHAAVSCLDGHSSSLQLFQSLHSVRDEEQTNVYIAGPFADCSTTDLYEYLWAWLGFGALYIIPAAGFSAYANYHWIKSTREEHDSRVIRAAAIFFGVGCTFF